MVVSAQCDTSGVITRVNADAAPCSYSINTDIWGAVPFLGPTHVCGQRRPYGMVVSSRCDTRVNVDAAPCFLTPILRILTLRGAVPALGPHTCVVSIGPNR